MGACASTHRKASAMKVHVSSGFNRKPDDHPFIPPSPTKEKPPIINGNVAVKPQWPPLHSTESSRDFASKEETFFDSQAWLESDCEDDFMKFTPSRGNTPVHHSFSAGILRTKGGAATIDDQKPSITPSNPTKKKMRLSDLFNESLREKHDVDEENDEAANENGVVGRHGAVAVDGGGGGFKPKRERWAESVQVHGCLPRLLSSCRPVTPQQTEGQTK
ncbi:hypothetical protein Ccrd_012402 [Cynara cardunculus var. scolymus]|uniref:Uncharacterized protein n=1 Tax=Cynara cardunculus var. scolymus TaxID=59895 RepID=A0A103YHJ3_CYNCS|nr:hypothetical protein Ccrd_012402 [Cynara cardunculus var. scolymus]